MNEIPKLLSKLLTFAGGFCAAKDGRITYNLCSNYEDLQDLHVYLKKHNIVKGGSICQNSHASATSAILNFGQTDAIGIGNYISTYDPIRTDDNFEIYIKRKQEKFREYSFNKQKGKTCSATGCDEECFAKDLCKIHYMKIYGKSWRKQNEDKIKVRGAIYYQNNKVKLAPQHSIYQKNHKEEGKGYQQKYHSKIFLRAIEIYGNKCQCCGNEDVVVLQWHHRKLGESLRTRKDGDNTQTANKIVKANKIFNDIMLLCANCHVLQNFIDGTSRMGIRTLRISQGTLTHRADIPLAIALGVYNTKCQCCGETNPILLQWHHRNGNKNHEAVSKIGIRIRDVGVILDDIMLLCANCHTHYDIEDGTRSRNCWISDSIQEIDTF